MIYHLLWKDEWETAQQVGELRPASLETEGFVHATKEPEKMQEVANLFFSTERSELLILSLDEEKIEAPIRYEDPGVGHKFPHIYGPVPVAAVVDVNTMQLSSDRKWLLPESLGE